MSKSVAPKFARPVAGENSRSRSATHSFFFSAPYRSQRLTLCMRRYLIIGTQAAVAFPAFHTVTVIFRGRFARLVGTHDDEIAITPHNAN